MSEIKKTGYFVGAAVLLALIAWAFAPDRITPDAFLDQGEPFYPEFTDPNEATTLEVVTFDETSGKARPFKVTFSGNVWTIPSHHNYPADAKDRLAQTAAGMIDIKKDDIRTSSVSEHEACGVIDPLDVAVPGLTGRGSRVTFKGIGDKVLADFIIGKTIPGREGFRFVRVPGQNRVYAARMKIDISTNFADWIETKVFDIKKDQMERVVLDNYSINERTSSVVAGEKTTLAIKDDSWVIDGMGSGSKPDSAMVQSLLTALEELSIVGVRPKPEGLSANLSGDSKGGNLSQQDRMSLSQKGFYFHRDGRLLSNEGEVRVSTADGIVYTLRFGEVLYGSGADVTSGLTDGEPVEGSGEKAENRYLFVTTEFNEREFRKPPAPKSTEFASKPDSAWNDIDRENKAKQDALDEWQRKVTKGRELSAKLNARFADWYYVISSESFDKVHLTRKDLTESDQG